VAPRNDGQAQQILEAARARRSDGQSARWAVVEERLRSIERDVADLKTRLWGLLVVGVGAVVVQVIAQIFRR
jgi:hypothetical protein